MQRVGKENATKSLWTKFPSSKRWINTSDWNFQMRLETFHSKPTKSLSERVILVKTFSLCRRVEQQLLKYSKVNRNPQSSWSIQSATFSEREHLLRMRNALLTWLRWQTVNWLHLTVTASSGFWGHSRICSGGTLKFTKSINDFNLCQKITHYLQHTFVFLSC